MGWTPNSVDPRAGIGTLLRAIAQLRRVKVRRRDRPAGTVEVRALARAQARSASLGSPREHLREPVARIFYSETPDPGRDPHVIRKNLMLMARARRRICESLFCSVAANGYQRRGHSALRT